jgi:hypothetical protein
VRAGVGIGCMAAALGGGRGSGVVVQPGDESRAVQVKRTIAKSSFPTFPRLSTPILTL